MSISRAEIGQRLARAGRAAEPDFLSDEMLFLRVHRENIDKRGRLSAAGVPIRMPCQSVNRARFSEPAWVLHPDWWENPAVAVAGVQHQAVPSSIPSESEYVWSFKVEHMPTETNYAHSEIQAARDGAYAPGLSVPKGVKQKARFLIAEKSTIIIQPGGGGALHSD